jgi:signal transduction histidine kinase
VVAETSSTWPSWPAGAWLRRAGFVAVAFAPAALALMGGAFRGRSLGDAALYALLVTPPLLLRRRWPAAVLAWVLAVSLALGPLALLAAMLALYSLALDDRRLVLLVAAVATVAALVAATALHGGRATLDGTVGSLMAVGVAVAAGRWQGTRARYVEQLRDRAARLEREQELLAGRAVAEERVRIARELHDVVGHSVSLIVVQAQAQALAAGEPDHDRATLLSLADSGRRAMTELHRMLGVLRIGECEDGAERAPQPGVDDLDALVADARAAGLDASLSLEGARRPLPPAVELSAYRIVQEALTNVVRHAGAARADVVVRFAPRQLELRVEDDGGTRPEPADVAAASRGGHGLIGMRERVALFGGSLDAGPRRDGAGFLVQAVLPLGDA